MITLCLFIVYEPQSNQNRLGLRGGMEESERGVRDSVTIGVHFF